MSSLSSRLRMITCEVDVVAYEHSYAVRSEVEIEVAASMLETCFG